MRGHQGSYTEIAFGEPFGAHGLIGEEAFVYSLNWLLEMQRRYGQPVFSMVGVRIVNYQRAVAAAGELRGYTLVDSLIEQLIDITREPDRCARSGDDTLWLLLPNTDKDGLAKVIQRLGGLTVLFRDSLPGMELRMKGIAAPLDVRMDEDADLLMARVAEELR